MILFPCIFYDILNKGNYLKKKQNQVTSNEIGYKEQLVKEGH